VVTPEDAADPFEGRTLGAYVIERRIGHGGMGTVYLAHRADQHQEQRVAIKMLRRGMDSELLVQRFRHERQILASLDHPNIARLFDGGSTDEGLPYFVMELVDGVPIDRYADEHRLSTPERLRLCLRIVDAVQHAHERQIVHRDLKPNNVLVTKDGHPKLLDFGIANPRRRPRRVRPRSRRSAGR
jgi:serine/threonine protein kinase